MPRSGTPPAEGQVHKVIRLVATSPRSWEDAARAGVAEATKTIVDLRTARVSEMDAVVDGSRIRLYRVKLEMVFQLDRSRRVAGSTETVSVHRHLIVANETLVSDALHKLVDARAAAGPAEFHVLVPQARGGWAGRRRRDPRAEAEERLRLFRFAFGRFGHAMTGEVGVGDPVAAVRRVLERSSFDEIILSILPPERSLWLRRDLPSRLERAVAVPVTTLVHDEGIDIATCPIG